MKMITFNKRQSRWILVFAEYDFEIKYCFKKINSVDESSRRSNYKKKNDDEICLFILQNKLKNIIIIVINMTFVMTLSRDEFCSSYAISAVSILN